VIEGTDVAAADQRAQAGVRLGSGSDAETGADVHRDTGTDFQAKAAFDEEEVIDADQGMADFDTEQGMIEINGNRIASG
jgi:hypothetical protein